MLFHLLTISYSMPSKALPKHFPNDENSQILAKCQACWIPPFASASILLLFDRVTLLENLCIFASVIRVRVSMALQFLDSGLSQGFWVFFKIFYNSKIPKNKTCYKE